MSDVAAVGTVQTVAPAQTQTETDAVSARALGGVPDATAPGGGSNSSPPVVTRQDT